MIPPTPTPLGPGDSLFTMPYAYGLWGGSSSAIQVWNWTQVGGTALQALLLVGIVLAGVMVLTQFIKDFTRRDSEE